MGVLIKNHLARLITISAALYAFAASIHGIFWPKIFFDFTTLNLDPAVKPIPILQAVNAVASLLVLAFEWPMRPLHSRIRRERQANILADTSSNRANVSHLGFFGRLHASILLRLVAYPATAVGIALLYQGTNAALYYVVAIVVWFWAYCEGEVVCPDPWTLPPVKGAKGAV